MKKEDLVIGKTYYYNGEDVGSFMPAGNVKVTRDVVQLDEEERDINSFVYNEELGLSQVVLSSCLSEIEGGN